MKNKSIRFQHLASFALVLVGAAGCGGNDEQSADADAGSVILDPAQTHYGLSNDEWMVRWWQWLNELPQDGDRCIIPIDDSTGEDCGYGQTKSSDAFFLTGTIAGTAVRDQCDVPAGKALYFPIVTFTYDNVGASPEEELSAAEMKEFVQALMDEIPIERLSVEFDGTAISDLGRFATGVVEYSYVAPMGPNVFSCFGLDGVSGEIAPAYAAGYFVMLRPPDSGDHVLNFAAESPGSEPPLQIDVTYEFTID